MRNCDLRHRCPVYEQDSVKCTFFYNFCKEYKEFYAKDEQVKAQDRENRLHELSERLVKLSGRES